MDVDQQVHRARQTEFDKEADAEVLERSKPRKLTGMDLAEARLSNGDVAAASAMAQQVLQKQGDTIASTADSARAYFILARAAAMTGHPEQAIDDFQKTLATSKEQRLLAWSHIYLGRMLDLDCKRDQAVFRVQAGAHCSRRNGRYAPGRGTGREERLFRERPHLRRGCGWGLARPGASQAGNGNPRSGRDRKAAIARSSRRRALGMSSNR